MKTILLVVIIVPHDGQTPVVQQIQRLDMPGGQLQAQSSTSQQRSKDFNRQKHRFPPLLAGTSCVAGS